MFESVSEGIAGGGSLQAEAAKSAAPHWSALFCRTAASVPLPGAFRARGSMCYDLETKICGLSIVVMLWLPKPARRVRSP